jgi:4'-phosphopantetheinyl transferase
MQTRERQTAQAEPDLNLSIRLDDDLPCEVIVWSVALHELVARAGALARCLSEQERARAQRFVFPYHRDRFIICRAALRQILADRLGLAPEAIEFRYGEHGKPALSPPLMTTPLQFNVSHTDECALIAVSTTAQLGVDVEKIRPEIVTRNLAAEIFCPAELGLLFALPPARVPAAFFKGWCAKEAYLKGTGKGLMLAPRDFEVCLDPDRPQRLLRPHRAAEQAAWSLHSLGAIAGHAAALATDRRRASIVQREWQVTT